VTQGRFSILRGGFGERPVLVMLGQVASALLSFLSAPVIARAIGVEGRGVTASVIAIAVVVPVLLGLGVPQEVRRHATAAPARDFMRAARILALCGVVPATAIAAVVAALMFREFDPGTRMAAFAAIAATPLAVWWACDLGVLVATRRFWAVMLMQIANPAVLLLSVGLMSVGGAATPALVIYSSIAGNAVTAAIGFVAVGHAGRSNVPIRSIVRRGLRFLGAGAAEVGLNRLPLIFALPLVGAFQAGLLSVAVTLMSIMLVIGQSLAAAHFRSAAISGHGSIPIRDAVAQSSALSSFAGLLLIGIVPFVIPALFGADFAPATASAIICLVASIPMVIGYTANSMLLAVNRGLAATTSNLVALLVQAGSLIALSEFGAVGFAIGIALGFLVQASVACRALRLGLYDILPWPRNIVAGIRALLTSSNSVGRDK
jgi:O-antigen/teichoic acid export membrane protein